jgi:hypothetical protein
VLLRLGYLPLARLAGLVLREKMVLWRSLTDLHLKCNEENIVLTLPKEFIEHVGVGKYGEQQDAHEFFMTLIAKLDEVMI